MFKAIAGLGIVFFIGAMLYLAWPLIFLAALGVIGYFVYRKSTQKARNTV